MSLSVQCLICLDAGRQTDLDALSSSSDVDRPSLKSNTMLLLEKPRHRTWCDACMRARGIAGRDERQEPGREDEDQWWQMIVKCDCTGDDGDDDDETTQTAHPGCERCENWNVCGHLSSRKGSE